VSSKGKKRGVISRKRLVIAACSIAALALVPAVAIAHIERASYWPDPAPDTSVSPPAGGAVPDARSLYTALDQAQPGDTRVVCQGQAVPYRADQDVSHARVDKLKAKLRKARKANKEEKARRLKRRLRRAKRNYRQALAAEMSARQAYQQQLGQQGSMQALDAATADARANGYKIRLSQPAIHPSDAELSQLRDFNAQLLAQCHYGSIQAAVNDSGNNDRVVVMPGLYTEPASRAAPTNDPACDQYEEQNDKGDTGAVSYR
jgi:hypothetical protein